MGWNQCCNLLVIWTWVLFWTYKGASVSLSTGAIRSTILRQTLWGCKASALLSCLHLHEFSHQTSQTSGLINREEGGCVQSLLKSNYRFLVNFETMLCFNYKCVKSNRLNNWAIIWYKPTMCQMLCIGNAQDLGTDLAFLKLTGS